MVHPADVSDPAALGRHGVLERNGNNCLAALPLLAFGAVGTWDLARPGRLEGPDRRWV